MYSQLRRLLLLSGILILSGTSVAIAETPANKSLPNKNKDNYVSALYVNFGPRTGYYPYSGYYYRNRPYYGTYDDSFYDYNNDGYPSYDYYNYSYPYYRYSPYYEGWYGGWGWGDRDRHEHHEHHGEHGGHGGHGGHHK